MIFSGSSTPLNSVQLLAFDALLTVLQSMATSRPKAQSSATANPADVTAAKVLRDKKTRKRQFQLGAEHFNRNPDHAFTVLQVFGQLGYQ